MVIKVYTSGLSGSKEIKKRQQRVLLILDSKKVHYEQIDITQPDQEEAKELMRKEAKSLKEGQPPLTPQIFNDEHYCGDYEDFDLANEEDGLTTFLKLEENNSSSSRVDEESNENGVAINSSQQISFDEKPSSPNIDENEFTKDINDVSNEVNIEEESGDVEMSESVDDAKTIEVSDSLEKLSDDVTNNVKDSAFSNEEISV